MKTTNVNYRISPLDSRKIRCDDLSCREGGNNLFRFGSHLMQSKHYRTFHEGSFSQWMEVSCVQNIEVSRFNRLWPTQADKLTIPKTRLVDAHAQRAWF